MSNLAVATAVAHPNIAFIKYWGNRNQALRLPANSSFSMNLAGLETKTKVSFDSAFKADQLFLNSAPATRDQLQRVIGVLDLVRGMSKQAPFARVESTNNFPSGSGIASSASAFAALALAASTAAGLKLDERDLSRLARRGSGSASRSVPSGFVEWRIAERDEDSYAYSIADQEHWALTDCIAVVSESHKKTGSTQGHELAATSPLQIPRLLGAEARLGVCRQAILDRDFSALIDVVELDNHLMHAVMMTSTPPLLYWQPASLAVMHAVRQWREDGLAACYTLDAGPNVHVITEAQDAQTVATHLATIPGVQRVLSATPGGAARLLAPS